MYNTLNVNTWKIFEGENVCGLVAFAAPTNAMPTETTSQIATNREIHKSFLPRKFPTICYTLVMCSYSQEKFPGVSRPPVWKRYKIAVRIGSHWIFHRLAIQDGYYVKAVFVHNYHKHCSNSRHRPSIHTSIHTVLTNDNSLRCLHYIGLAWVLYKAEQQIGRSNTTHRTAFRLASDISILETSLSVTDGLPPLLKISSVSPHQCVQSLHLFNAIVTEVQLLQVYQLLETFYHCQTIALW